MNAELSTHDKDLLLMVLKHYLPSDVRRRVMHEVPGAYNAWMGRDIMVTVQASKLAENGS